MILRRFLLLPAAAAVILSCAGKPAPLPPPPAPVEAPVEVPTTVEAPAPAEAPEADRAAAAPEPADTAVGAEAPEAGAEKAAAAPPEPFALSGQGRKFAFAVPKPAVFWKAGPDGSSVRLQLAGRDDFAEGSILFELETGGDSAVIDAALAGDAVYFLRGRRILPGGMEEDWTAPAEVSYRPLPVPMRTVIAPGKTASFTMGNRNGAAREKPEHRVTLTRSYEMGAYELTNALLADILNRMLDAGLVVIGGDGNVSGPDGSPYAGIGKLNYGVQFGLEERGGRIRPRRGRENHPAVGVSRPGAEAVCNALSRMYGRRPFYPDSPPASGPDPEADGFRLPTEAEWEYAARGGGPGLFPGGGRTADPRRVNFHRSGDPFETLRQDVASRGGPTTPAGYYDGRKKGSFATLSGASPFGLQDMLGNVWEWCEDFFDPGYYAASPEENPSGPGAGEFRSVRGGAWNTPGADVSPSARGWYKPDGFSYSVGMRLARSLPRKAP